LPIASNCSVTDYRYIEISKWSTR